MLARLNSRTLFLSLALLFAGVSNAQAQVTIESVRWDWDVGAASLDVTAVNTSIGSNTALVAAVCFNNNDFQLPVSVTLDPGGASQTSLDWLDVGDQAAGISPPSGTRDDGHCTIWGVKNPPSGTFIVRVLLDAATQGDEGLNVGVWSLSGVDQTTPFRDAIGVSGETTDGASITVPSESGDLVLAAAWVEWYDSSSRLAVSGAGIEDFDIPGVSSEDLTVGQHKTATGTSTVLTWTNDNNPSPKWAIIGVAVIPAAGCGPATLPFSDSFTRTNSSTVGNCWVESETGTADAIINTNRLQLTSDDEVNSPRVLHTFTNVSTGFLKWTYVFNWDRTPGKALTSCGCSWGTVRRWSTPRPAITRAWPST
ncbi:MAG: hypothetical protein IIC36_06475 [Gemmatimonadetes bacterium]|nr:hypothetical protein [Gemmatimonadota bacterium]